MQQPLVRSPAGAAARGGSGWRGGVAFRARLVATYSWRCVFGVHGGAAGVGVGWVGAGHGRGLSPRTPAGSVLEACAREACAPWLVSIWPRCATCGRTLYGCGSGVPAATGRVRNLGGC